MRVEGPGRLRAEAAIAIELPSRPLDCSGTDIVGEIAGWLLEFQPPGPEANGRKGGEG